MLVCYGENNRVGREMDGFEKYLGNSQQNLVVKSLWWVRVVEMSSMTSRYLAFRIRDRNNSLLKL